ncbi:MAG: methionine--tRNA ligase, partial [Candidatus Moranbacteria bacterium]|nr:methionine--tRNA ligase [Candidatus Moranbacteria bacterium]
MDKKDKFYITTTLPYVNAQPHAGFAMEIIEADVLARFNRQLGREVFFNTGTDEHGLKLFRKAEELKMEVQDYVDQQAENFKSLKEVLNISYDNFIRTTDKQHIVAAQEFWKRCEKNGDIYKKSYKTKYCVGCESEKTDSDLVDGKCPDHPSMEIEIIEEENYFFRFSKYQKQLLDLYEKNPEFVLPKNRLKEIKNFVEGGLEDFSISRLRAKMPWGIEVPGDEQQVIYVWFDALINYISTLGWPTDMKNFEAFWPAVQIAGKDNLRFQSAMWQSMLLSAGIEPSKQIFINGFITVDGKKMSKSTGNVISPAEM